MVVDYDSILQELGQFGRYQKKIFVLFGYVGFVLSLTGLSYVFTAGDMRYRCYVEECDKHKPVYEASWLKNAVPFETKNEQQESSRCYKFQHNNSTFLDRTKNTCPSEWFLNSTEPCSRWVYEGPETTILNEWDLACDDVGWRLALVGTVNAVAHLVSLPITGYLSDRIGRRKALLITLTAASIIGFSRSYAQSYLQFILLEGLTMLVGSGAYVSAFILAMETVGPDKRVMGTTIMSLLDALGFASLGLIAWLVPNWRILIRVLHITGLVFIIYFWFLPESVRWLLVQKRFQEAKTIIHKVAKTNRVALSEATMKKLNDSSTTSLVDKEEEDKKTSIIEVMQQVLQSRTLLLRLLNCFFCWATNAFVYYGLALNSVELGGSKYVNFILACLSDLPSFPISYYAMDTIGRKKTIAISLLLSGISCFGFVFTPQDMPWLILILLLFGKMAICSSFTTLYAFTTEIFPTSIRNSLMGTCSMVGRVGSIVATQTPSLGRYMASLPAILFGVVSIIGGILALFFPETKGIKLPDSVKASENLTQEKENVVIVNVISNQNEIRSTRKTSGW